MECQFYECSIISPKAVDIKLRYLEFTECSLIGVHWQELQQTGTIAVPFSLLEGLGISILRNTRSVFYLLFIWYGTSLTQAFISGFSQPWKA